MDDATVERYAALFRAYRVSHPLDKFICYLNALVAKLIYEDGEFDDYFSAWSSPKAGILRGYLDCFDSFHVKFDRPFLNSLARNTSSQTAIDFVSRIASGLFPGSVEAVFSCIRYRDNTDLRDEIYSLLRLLAVLEVRNDPALNSHYPPRQQRLKSEEYSAVLYQEFKSWEQYKKVYSKLRNLNEKDFYQIWLTAYGIDFRPEPIRIQHGLSTPIRKLRDDGLSNEELLQLFFLARVYSRFDSKKITVPLSYLKAALLDENGSKLQTKSPGMRFYSDEVLLNKALENWRDTDTVDFIRALYFADAPRNIATENLLVYPQLGTLFNSALTGLIIEPNPDFVAKLLADDRISNERVVIAFLSLDLAQVYKERFPEGQFAFLDLNDTPGPSLQLQIIDETSRKRIPEFISESSTGTFGFVNIFFRPWLEDTFTRLLSCVHRWTIDLKSTVNVYLPHSLLDRPKQSIRHALSESYLLFWALLFPKAKSSDWLKKNLLLCLIPNHGSESRRDFLVFRANAFPSGSDGLTIIRDPWPVRIPPEDVLTGEKTINSLWEKYRPKHPAGEGRTTRYYDFSSEIRIWYSWSNGRGRFHFYACPTQAQLRKNPMARGKRLASTHQFSTPDIPTMEETIAETLLNTGTEWQECIRKEISARYRKKAISLKTFWYVNIDRLEGRLTYKADIAKTLFSSKELSEMLSDRQYTLEDYQRILDADFSGFSQSEQVALWRQLNLILNLAVQEGRFRPNPISEHVTSLLERDKGYRAARAALVKKSYHLNEERIMLDFMKKQAKRDSKYLGCLISFYTGMPSGEICALTWADYRKPNIEGLGQLMVSNVVLPSIGKQRFRAEERYRYRRIPCVFELTHKLDERKDAVLKQLQEKGQKASVLSQMPIVCDSESDLFGSCKVSSLNRAKDDVENAANIEVLSGLLPLDDDTESITDFNNYRADRFRANFRYRASQTCLMSKAEFNYILGISPPTTFSKHYCDYSNDLAQILLRQKLERWVDAHEHHELSEARPVPLDSRGEFRSKLQARSCLELEISANSAELDHSGKFMLDISVPRGADILLYKIR